MIDLQRAAWFRDNARFDRCRITRKSELWESWLVFVGEDDPGSKGALFRWLMLLGMDDHGSFVKGVVLSEVVKRETV